MQAGPGRPCLLAQQLDPNERALDNGCCVLLCAQGMSQQAAQQLLVAPQLAAAVWQVLRQYAPLVPALRDRSQDSIALALQSASSRLQFVRSCHTRLIRAPSTDVTRHDVPSQVRAPHAEVLAV